MDRIAGTMAENTMEIKRIDYDFSVCKVEDYSLAKLDLEYCFKLKVCIKIIFTKDKNSCLQNVDNCFLECYIPTSAF